MMIIRRIGFVLALMQAGRMLKQRKIHEAACRLICAMLVSVGAAMAQGEEFVWISDEGGSFHAPEHWEVNGVPAASPPGEEDNCRFALPAQYTLTFAQNVETAETTFNDAAAEVAWQLNENTYTTGELGLYDGGNLSITAGTVSARPLYVRQGILTLTGSGTDLASVGGTSYVGAHIGGIGELHVLDGASFTHSSGGLYVGNQTARIGIIVVSGAGSSADIDSMMYLARRGGRSEIHVRDGGHMELGSFIIDPRAGSYLELGIDGGTVHRPADMDWIGSGDPDPQAETRLSYTLHPGMTNAGLTVSGDLTMGTNAHFNLSLADDFSGTLGEVFTVINVGGSRAGLFKNPQAADADLAEGDILVFGDTGGPLFQGYKFKVSYAGGAGNDFTLTTVAVPVRGILFRVY